MGRKLCYLTRREGVWGIKLNRGVQFEKKKSRAGADVSIGGRLEGATGAGRERGGGERTLGDIETIGEPSMGLERDRPPWKLQDSTAKRK